MKNSKIKDKIILEDLKYIFKKTEYMWKELEGKKIFFTGATGFFGKLLLNSFIYNNNKLNLNASAVVLTRKLNNNLLQIPEIKKNNSIKFHIGDIRNFKFPKEDFSHIIHGATTTASETFNKQNPLTKYETIVKGTEHLLKFASKCNCEKFLLLSSAAAYGKQPKNKSHILEKYIGAPSTIDKNFDYSVLGNAKRAAEMLTTIFSETHNIDTKIARCFSFVGPYIPLDIHYAIGNFIKDAIKNQCININGDGTSIRSYMYTSDLTIWLWTILFKGKNSELYNVGSEEKITIKQLAKKIAKLAKVKVNINKQNNKNFSNYVPSTIKARKMLGVKIKHNLTSSIKRTMEHVKNNKTLYNLKS